MPFDSSSDDGGLKHITTQRARPPKRRGVAQAQQPSPTKSGWCSSDSSEDGDRSEECASPSNSAAPHQAVQPRPFVSPPPEPQSPQPRFQKHEYVYYKRPADPDSYQALVTSVDVTVMPPSYVVRFSDNSERTTEEAYLFATPPPTAVAEPEPQPQPASATPPPAPLTPAEAHLSATCEDLMQEDPRLNASMVSSASTSNSRARKDKKDKKERKEKERARREERKERRAARSEAAAAAAEEGDANGGDAEAPKAIPKPSSAAAQVKLGMRHLQHPHPAVARVVPNTKLYASFIVEKISNRGFRHKRVMVVTSVYIVYAKEDGEIRKWFELSHLDKVFLQETGGGGMRVLLRLSEASDEPDVVLSCRGKADNRNSHPAFAEVLKVITHIHRARLEATGGKRALSIEALPSDVDLRSLVRHHVEKPDVEDRRRALTVMNTAAGGRSFSLKRGLRSGAALQQQIAQDEESDPEDGGLASLPKWKPDSAVTSCEDCSKSFTLIRRKHHCRACGGVFCGSCTSARCVVARIGREPVRVCDPCRQRLSEKL